MHAAMMREHPEAYSTKANVQLSVSKLRDQIAAPARTILLVLLAAAAVVFVIACSNVANLILARSVRREGELAVRAALGAGHGALRRTLLAESLVLCGAGAVLGVVAGAAVRRAASRAMPRASRSARSTSPSIRACSGSAPAWRWPRPCCSRTCRGCRRRTRRPASAWRAAASGSRRAPTAAFACSRRRRLRSRSCCSPARACSSPRSSRCRRRTPATTCGRCSRFDIPPRRPASAARGDLDFYERGDAAHQRAAGRRGRAVGEFRAVARRRHASVPAVKFARRGLHAGGRRREPDGADARRRASLLRGARRPDARRPRLHRRRPRRQRARVDRQPERGAAAVPERRRGEPAAVVDRSVLRQAACRAASSASSRTWTTRAWSGDRR